MEFDPSKPFDKVEFDPNQEFEMVDEGGFDPSQGFDVMEQDPSLSETFLHKLGQGASFGFSDEIYAALKSGELSGEEYEKIRDKYRKRLKKMEEANPKTALAGDLAGAIGTGILFPWSNATKGASLAKIAGISATEGAAAGLGYSDEEDAKGIAKDTAIAAGLGGALGAAGGKLLRRKGDKNVEEGFDLLEKEMKKDADIAAKAAKEVEPEEEIAKTIDDIPDVGESVDLIDKMNYIKSLDEGELIRASYNTFFDGVPKELIEENPPLAKALKSFQRLVADKEASVTDKNATYVYNILKKAKDDPEYGKVFKDSYDLFTRAIRKEKLNADKNAKEGFDDLVSAMNKPAPEPRKALSISDGKVIRNPDIERVTREDMASYDELLNKSPDQTLKRRGRNKAADGLVDIELNRLSPKVRKIVEEQPIAPKKVEEAVDELISTKDTILANSKKIGEEYNTGNLADDLEGIATEFPEYARWQMNPNTFNREAFNSVLKNKKPLTEKEMARLVSAAQQGRLTPESYLEFEELRSLFRDTGKYKKFGGFAEDGKENFLVSNFEAVNTKARRMDDKMPELKLEKDIDELNKVINKVDAEVNKRATEMGKIADKISEEGLSGVELISQIETGKATSEAAAMIKKLYNEMADDLERNGFRITRLKDYVKRAWKSDLEVVEAMKERITKFKDLDNEEKRELIAIFKSRFPDMKVKGAGDIKEALDYVLMNPTKRKELRKSQTFKSATDREGGIPEWARETNVLALIDKSIREAAQVKHLRPIGEKIKSKARILDEVGLTDQAKYFDEFADDFMGISDPIEQFALTKYLKKIFGYGDKETPNLDYVARQLLNAPYVAHLGTTPIKVARNSLQVFNHTIPHMYGSSPTAQLKAFKEWMNVWTNPKQWINKTDEIAEYKRKGYIASDMNVGQIRDAIDVLKDKGVKINPKVKMIGDGWETIGKILLAPYTQSDTLNRVTTIRLAKGLVDDIVSGSKLGQKALDNLPEALRRDTLDLLSRGMREGAEDSIISHYLAKTQFAYNKSQRHKLARQARGLGVFSKWPVQTTSELLYDINKRDFGSSMHKYGVPLMAMGAMGYGMWSANPELYKDITGREGATAGMAWSPAYSTGSFGSPLGYQLDTLISIAGLTGKAVTESAQGSDYADKAWDALYRKIYNSGYLAPVNTLGKVTDFIDVMQD